MSVCLFSVPSFSFVSFVFIFFFAFEADWYVGILHVRAAVQGKVAAPVQLHVNPGDIVLAHYQTAHAIAPNISPNVRYACYFRLHHHSHQYDQGPLNPAKTSLIRLGKPDCLTNIWVDFDGIRDLAKEMKERGEV